MTKQTIEQTGEFARIGIFLSRVSDAALERIAGAALPEWFRGAAVNPAAESQRCLVGHALDFRLSARGCWEPADGAGLPCGTAFDGFDAYVGRFSANDFDALCDRYTVEVAATACRAAARTELSRRRGGK